ncbi:20S proteasome subunit [Chiua virens]|nr:20S proteasome subunit [Chiua virens]
MDRIDMDRLKTGEVDLGTSIMAVQFDRGVVIGADSRTTTGSYIANRVTDKLTHVHDRMYCCRSGSAADTQAIADIVHYHCQLVTQTYHSSPTVASTAAFFEKMCYENKDQVSAGIIVAGWDKETGPSVYNIPLEVDFSASHGLLAVLEGWGEDETIEFVKNTLALAMSRDGSSGGVIRMCVITEEGVERLFVPGNQLPTFWEGKEVLAAPIKKAFENVPVPMVVE